MAEAILNNLAPTRTERTKEALSGFFKDCGELVFGGMRKGWRKLRGLDEEEQTKQAPKSESNKDGLTVQEKPQDKGAIPGLMQNNSKSQQSNPMIPDPSPSTTAVPRAGRARA